MTDETLDLDKLESVARAAMQGPWQELHNMAGPMGVISGDALRQRICWLEINASEHENATHIATFAPPTVLRLIALARASVPEGEKDLAQLLGQTDFLTDPDALDAFMKANPLGPDVGVGWPSTEASGLLHALRELLATCDSDDEDYRASGRLLAQAAIDRAMIAAAPESIGGAPLDSELCDDCPPVGYSTDKTRCAPCPRRAKAALPTPPADAKVLK